MRPRSRGRRCLPIGAVAALAWLAATGAAALEVPYLSGRVVDAAGMLPADAKGRVEQKLEAFERATGAQIAVLTIPSLEGDPLEDFSMRVVETWKLGRESEDDGALLLIARDDRKMRIEVGYGLEGQLTDLMAGRILDEMVRPKFRDGDFAGGIETGVDAMLGVLEGREVLPAAPARVTGDLQGRAIGFLVYLVVTGVFSAIALFSTGPQSWFLYVFLMPFHLLFPMIVHPFLGLGIAAAWAVGFPIFKLWAKATGRAKTWASRWPNTPSAGRGLRRGGWGGFVGGGGGGGWRSSGGGGFSGGGGSFGGGGSSSSW
jgi:uncharacterized protein